MQRACRLTWPRRGPRARVCPQVDVLDAEWRCAMRYSSANGVMRTMHIALAAALLAVTLALVTSRPAVAAGTVGNGSPGSCTAGALDTALAGGGLVTFNC